MHRPRKLSIDKDIRTCHNNYVNTGAILNDSLLKKFVLLLLASLTIYALITLANSNSQNNGLTISKALGVGGTGPEFTPTPIATSSPTPTFTVTPTSIPTPTQGPDTTPPSVGITFPPNGGTVPRNSVVTITADASDNIGVTSVQFSVNGALKCTDTTAPYTCNWLVPAPKKRSYTIVARAYDAANNSSTSTVVVTSN